MTNDLPHLKKEYNYFSQTYFNRLMIMKVENE